MLPPKLSCEFIFCFMMCFILKPLLCEFISCYMMCSILKPLLCEFISCYMMCSILKPLLCEFISCYMMCSILKPLLCEFILCFFPPINDTLPPKLLCAFTLSYMKFPSSNAYYMMNHSLCFCSNCCEVIMNLPYHFCRYFLLPPDKSVTPTLSGLFPSLYDKSQVSATEGM